MSLNAIQKSYIRNFPTQVPMKAAQGFVVTLVINLIANNHPSNVALLGGAIAATATVIEALTRPIIKAIFPEHPLITRLIQVITPKVIALSLAASVAPWIGVSYTTTSFVLPLIAWIILNEGFYENNVAMAEVL